MWTCASCGFELDDFFDSADSCPACGAPRGQAPTSHAQEQRPDFTAEHYDVAFSNEAPIASSTVRCASCGFELDAFFSSSDTCPACGASIGQALPTAPSEQQPVSEIGRREAMPSSEAFGFTSTPQPSSTPREPVATAVAQTAGASEQQATALVSAKVESEAEQARAEQSCDTVLVLTESRSGEKIRIDSLSCVLGREGDYRPELFSDRVSREQIEINNVDGTWTVCHIGNTNPSGLISRTERINMAYGIEYPLHGGERLRLANQTFLVRIENLAPAEESPSIANAVSAQAEPSQPMPSQSTQPADDNTVEGWFITCGRCGSVFMVEGAETRLSECPRCIDVMDKREIRRSVPAFGRKNRSSIIDVR